MCILFMTNGLASPALGRFRGALLCSQMLSSDVPKLSPEDKTASDLSLSIQELKSAAFLMALGHPPGVVGLPIEFYTMFW